MKLPQIIEGIHREGRTDSLVSAGVEPAFLGKLWKKIKQPARSAACVACNLIPNPIGQAACRAAFCR